MDMDCSKSFSTMKNTLYIKTCKVKLKHVHIVHGILEIIILFHPHQYVTFIIFYIPEMCFLLAIQWQLITPK